MRAVVVDCAATIHIETRPDPVLPGPDGVIVEVESTAICGSDLHFLQGHYPIVDPVSLGHEAVGTVVETGSAVTGFSNGDGIDPPSAQAIREATDGLGADAVIDAVGSDASISDSIEAVRAGGTVSIVGVHDLQPYPLPALGCLIRSVTVRFTTAPVQQTWPTLVPLLRQGRIDVEGIFTDASPLDRAADGYAAAMSRSGDHLKVRLDP